MFCKEYAMNVSNNQHDTFIIFSGWKRSFRMSYSDLNDDIWYQILLYLDLKGIYCLELANPFFPSVLKRLRFWNMKINKDFPHCDVVINSVQEAEVYTVARRVYWSMYQLNHTCNICRLCLVDNIVDDIPDNEWIDYLD